jgi:hypothetical protein
MLLMGLMRSGSMGLTEGNAVLAKAKVPIKGIFKGVKQRAG